MEDLKNFYEQIRDSIGLIVMVALVVGTIVALGVRNVKIRNQRLKDQIVNAEKAAASAKATAAPNDANAPSNEEKTYLLGKAATTIFALVIVAIQFEGVRHAIAELFKSDVGINVSVMTGIAIVWIILLRKRRKQRQERQPQKALEARANGSSGDNSSDLSKAHDLTRKKGLSPPKPTDDDPFKPPPDLFG